MSNFTYLSGLIFLILSLASHHLLAQFNIYSSNVTLVGLGAKTTTHQGFLGSVSVSYDYFDQEQREYTFYDEYATGLSLDCRHINFTRNSVISMSGESALYVLGELLSNSSYPYKGPFNFVAGQQTESLIDWEISGMEEYQKRWINLRHIEGNATFGFTDIQIGVHASLRSLGYPDFTTTGENFQIFDTGDLVTKLLLGPAIGFRKTIDNVNVIAFGSVSGSFNTKESYKLKYSPHAEVTLMLGKKVGVFASVYLRSYEGHFAKYESKTIAPRFVEAGIHGGLFFCRMH